jgi:hypothetical protein
MSYGVFATHRAGVCDKNAPYRLKLAAYPEIMLEYRTTERYLGEDRERSYRT